MAVREAVRRRWRGARSSRSRTTSDFEIFRPRDFRLNVRHQWLGQSYGETLHEVIVLHLGTCARQAKVKKVKQSQATGQNE